MPIGTFLDTLPPVLFIATHIIFLIIGVWVAKKAMDIKLKYALAFWLYPIVHIGFLLFFMGALTFKMSVLLEQMLVLAMVLWIFMKSQESHQS